MPEPYKGPTPEVGERHTPQDARSNRTPGSDQQQPRPNENLQNQPFSSDKTLDPENQQHHWNDQDDAAGESAGVTQEHASPQQSRENQGGSSTGLPQSEDNRNPSSDHNSRTQAEGNDQATNAGNAAGGDSSLPRGGLDHNWERNAGVDADDEDLGNQPERNELAGASQREQGTLDPYQTREGGTATPPGESRR